ncbi:hypothetical protein F2Q69_00047064 [Brassica cretica]|uniref:Uncharacterized protein n=1 Tax=Brassica cretica TaxID=69181 RepID=A0A8S9PKS9_BRACR|nr:hypothetical protein F2Q69_00047064 [Brassica cretica]
MAGFWPMLSESEKGKGIVASLSLSIDRSSGPKLLDISGDVVDSIAGRLDGAVDVPDELGKNDEIVGTEIRTVDFRLNKETRKTLISQRSRISANTTRQAIRTRNENSNEIRNRKREQDSSYSESAFERLQQGKCLGYESCRRDSYF